MSDSEAEIRAVIADASLGEVTQIDRVAAGGNNRGFKVQTDRATVFVKIYFRDAADPRDRLGADFGFSQFAWSVGARALPQPLWSDQTRGAAIFSFISGWPLAAGAVVASHVEQALDFWAQINRHRSEKSAQSLPAASEACFSIADHLQIVQRRIEKLSAIAPTDDIDRTAQKFVNDKLLPGWRQVREKIENAAMAAKDQPIPTQYRCLSPSDFGFHNALQTESGSLIFHDFEYAGWDDPAKLVGDFFCQPKIPVPASFRTQFIQRVMQELSLPPEYQPRINLLMDVCRLKWCCIVLNEFLPAGARRRQFAQNVPDFQERKRRQLDLAAHLLDRTDLTEN